MTEMSVVGAEHYQLAWLIYCLAGAGFLAACWQLLKLISRAGLKWFLFSVLFFGIFTPSWGVVEGHRFIAPAVLVAAFDFLDGLDKSLGYAIKVALDSLVLLVGLIVLSGSVIAARSYYRHSESSPQSDDSE